MFLPPVIQQPAPPPAKAEPGALAALLQKRGVILSLKRKPLGALYGRGTVEVESLEASEGTDTRKGLGFHVMGPAKSDGEGRALIETSEVTALLAALDRFQTEAPKLASGDADTSLSFTSNGGLTLEMDRGRDGVALTLRAGRGEAVFAAGQIAALRQLVEKAK